MKDPRPVLLLPLAHHFRNLLRAEDEGREVPHHDRPLHSKVRQVGLAAGTSGRRRRDLLVGRDSQCTRFYIAGTCIWEFYTLKQYTIFTLHLTIKSSKITSAIIIIQVSFIFYNFFSGYPKNWQHHVGGGERGISVGYTLIGGMISVAYTDVFQLFFIAFGLVKITLNPERMNEIVFIFSIKC